MAQDIEQGIAASTPTEPNARLCNFATGSAHLQPEHRRWLDSKVIPILNETPDAMVAISGMASRLGKGDANDRLALARAEAVAKYIQEGIGRTLVGQQNIYVGSYGESISGGGRADNDGFYRAAIVSVSQSGKEPPRHIPVFGELRKLENDQIRRQQDKVMEMTYVGVGAKGGGMYIVGGAEDTEGMIMSLGAASRYYYFGVTSIRLGLGIGASAGAVAIFMLNTCDPHFFHNSFSKDWGVNFSAGGKWDGVVKSLKNSKALATLASLGAKAGKMMKATPAQIETLRNGAHIFYSEMDLKMGGEPTVVVIDIPFAGGGAEVSAFGVAGLIRIGRVK